MESFLVCLLTLALVPALAQRPVTRHRNLRLLSKEDCGWSSHTKDSNSIINTRIIGGMEAMLGEFPWLALLQYITPEGQIALLCGGALINERYVLTAAHCIRNDATGNDLHSVRLGEHNIAALFDCEMHSNGTKRCADPAMDFLIEEIIPHPEYQGSQHGNENDIGLLRLAEDVPLSEFVRPICLPLDVMSTSYDGHTLYMAGWGRTENSDSSAVKLVVELPVVANRQCAKRYRLMGHNVVNTQLCAGGVRGRDSCSGDSGGGLMSVQETALGQEKVVLVGVASYGTSPCGLDGWPGVYTRVTHYLHWVLDQMRG